MVPVPRSEVASLEKRRGRCLCVCVETCLTSM